MDGESGQGGNAGGGSGGTIIIETEYLKGQGRMTASGGDGVGGGGGGSGGRMHIDIHQE